MKMLARQVLLLGVCATVMAMGFADDVHGETAPVVVGLAKCADCTRKNMNAAAAFSGLQVAVKCKNGKGEYESKAVGHVDRSGAFSVPLATDLVGEDGKLKQECFAQLHSTSSTPCSGQEPSKIVAAPSGHGSQKKTFVAVAGKVHRTSSPECASVFLCYPFIHNHHPADVIPTPNHGHSLPPVTTVPVHEPPSTPVYTPPKPTPIYHPPAERDAVNDPQMFKKLFPFFKKKPFLFKFPFFPPAAQESKH